MTFTNQKKTFLEKLDKSKKGFIDVHAQDIINTINKLENYYTTSSCSGRMYFWRSSGRKDETEWINVSHELVSHSFFKINNTSNEVWLRYEGFILHVACKDQTAANELLKAAQQVFKKSTLLSFRKLIVEIRSSDIIEMPFYQNGQLVFSGDKEKLAEILNNKQKENWNKIKKLEQLLLSNFSA